jgi:thiamine biosynthesis lipoprotein
MRQTEFRAMGTDVVAIADDVAGVRDWFAAAEGIFSRFLEDSELSRLNSSAEGSVAVSGPLARCLASAQDLRDRTGGLVDPAIGGAVLAWGYDRTFSEVSDREQSDSVDGIGHWSIEGNVVTRRPGVVLDLGGIAKGWTCDKAVTSGLADVVSAGGDMRSAHQDTVAEITDPWGEIAARVVLGEGGLATSSTTRRQWSVGDTEANHIIDPRRLAPARSPIFSATVTARTAVEAEAGAKAVLLRGEDGLAWAEQQDWITAALAVWHDGNVYATTGWEMAA